MYLNLSNANMTVFGSVYTEQSASGSYVADLPSGGDQWHNN
jgi:hypothetical protein